MTSLKPARVLITADEIAARVSAMALEIRADHPDGVHLIGVLNGAVVFLSDLIRQMEGAVTLDFVAVSSYGDGTTSTGRPRLIKDIEASIDGRAVVIVEDIVDGGLTLSALLDVLKARNPRSLKTACLLDKPARRRTHLDLDYVGFTIEDHFVVGYGLDHAGFYRNLPYIGALDSLTI